MVEQGSVMGVVLRSQLKRLENAGMVNVAVDLIAEILDGQLWRVKQRSNGVIEVGDGGIDIAKELSTMCDSAVVRLGRVAYTGRILFTIDRAGRVQVHEPPGLEAVIEDGTIVAFRRSEESADG